MKPLMAPQLSDNEDQRADQIWQWYLRILDAKLDAIYNPATDWAPLRTAATTLINVATEHLTDRVNSYNLGEPLKPCWLSTFHRQLAHICRRAGDNHSAAEALKQAIDLNPWNVDARADLISLLLEQEQVSSAVEQINRLEGMIHLEGYEMAARVLEWILSDSHIATQVNAAILRECVALLSQGCPGAKILLNNAPSAQAP